MELHHKKHHQTYVNALNAAETAYAKTTSPKERIGLQAALKFNGGGMFVLPAPDCPLISSVSGHINHSLFWKNLAPSANEGKGSGGRIGPGPLKDAIDAAFGSVENMKTQFNATTAAIQGSGWGWIVSGASSLTIESDLICLPFAGLQPVFACPRNCYDG